MPQQEKPSLFISYRRGDSPDTVALLYERLKQRLPRWEVFYDHHSIPLGKDFPGPAAGLDHRCGAKAGTGMTLSGATATQLFQPDTREVPGVS